MSTAVPGAAKPKRRGSLLQSVTTALGRRNQLAPLAMKPDTENPLLITAGLHNMPREDCGTVLVLWVSFHHTGENRSRRSLCHLPHLREVD